MEFHVVIPARRASVRLPNKPLLDIAGEPMIVRVCQQASQVCSDVCVATDDDAIAAAVRDAGFSAELTLATHESGTDRVYEVCERRGWPADAVVVNVQGDEPLLPALLINQAARGLVSSGADIATLATPIVSRQEFDDPNVVKVVRNDAGDALYFSRAAIPYDRAQSADVPSQARRHIGLYAYRVKALRAFVDSQPAQSEQLERLEQLRALAIGLRLQVIDADVLPPAGVDTANDLDRVRRYYLDANSKE